MYSITKWKSVDIITAKIKYIFKNIPHYNNDFSSLIALIALNISIMTRFVKAKLDAFYLPRVKYLHGSLSKL
jgi:hypothetical protein